MAVAPVCPARPLQGLHPLTPPLLPQLRLQPHRDPSAHCGLPGNRGDEAYFFMCGHLQMAFTYGLDIWSIKVVKVDALTERLRKPGEKQDMLTL